jgi:DNA-binding NarL/FixJ family response regulator
MNTPTITLRPVAGFAWQCPQCTGPNQTEIYTPCVTCAHCGLVCNAQVHSDLLACLTDRECQILLLIAEGNTNSEIGSKLELAPSTTRNYVSEVFKKINVSNRAEAAAVAVRELKPTRRKS